MERVHALSVHSHFLGRSWDWAHSAGKAGSLEPNCMDFNPGSSRSQLWSLMQAFPHL